jgi:hypothetical protein
MPKTHHGTKESKKAPAMSAKEKRTAKRTKKHGKDTVPFLPPETHH